MFSWRNSPEDGILHDRICRIKKREQEKIMHANNVGQMQL
jgi:hypothetical protein